MKKSVLLLLPLYLISFVGCKSDTNNKIVLRLTSDKNGLTWNKVKGAEKYAIIENSGAPTYVYTPMYIFNTDEVETTVTIIAIVNGQTSSYATYKYIGYDQCSFTPYYYHDWGEYSLFVTDLKAADLLYKDNDLPYVSIFETEKAHLVNYGYHTLKAVAGVKKGNGDEPNLYFKKDRTVTYVIPYDIDVPECAYIDDGEETTEELQSIYTIKEKTTHGWENTNDVQLVANSSGVSGGCIELKFKKNQKHYKIERNLDIPFYSFYELYLEVKSLSATGKTYTFTSNAKSINGMYIPKFSMSVTSNHYGDDWFNYYGEFSNYWDFTLSGSETINLMDQLLQAGITADNYASLVNLFDTFSIEFYSAENTNDDISLCFDNISLFS